MRWLLSACFLGGLAALFRHWQWPYADWLNLAGFGVLLLGFLLWFNDSRDYWPSARSQGTGADAGMVLIPSDTGSDPGSFDLGSSGGGGDGGFSSD